VAIAKAIEERLKGRVGNPALTPIKEKFPELEQGQSRDLAAEKSGFGSGKTYEAAKKAREWLAYTLRSWGLFWKFRICVGFARELPGRRHAADRGRSRCAPRVQKTRRVSVGLSIQNPVGFVHCRMQEASMGLRWGFEGLLSRARSVCLSRGTPPIRSESQVSHA
jgi:hypothetical protein